MSEETGSTNPPDADRQTRSHLVALLERHGLRPRFDLGQNFLIDLNLIELVAREADLGPRDVVLEVGAGTAGLSTYLARDAGAVVSVEIDPNIHALAAERLAALPHVTLLNCDALKNKNTLSPVVLEAVETRLKSIEGGRLKLVANLPYSVATPVVSNLVATELPWDRMVITIQWELAERMTAQAGTGAYGALSVWLQSQTRLEILRRLPPNVFWPRPKVDSAIVRIVPDAALRATIDDRAFFHEFIRQLFNQRRKALRAALVAACRDALTKSQVDEILTDQGLTGTTRAEELPPETLVRLANRVRATMPPIP